MIRRWRRRVTVFVRKGLLLAAALALAVAALALALLQTRVRHGRDESARCPAGPTTPGIDVSYHQDAIDWPRVRRAGIHFAFIRVSDGATARARRRLYNCV